MIAFVSEIRQWSYCGMCNMPTYNSFPAMATSEMRVNKTKRENSSISANPMKRVNVCFNQDFKFVVYTIQRSRG